MTTKDPGAPGVAPATPGMRSHGRRPTGRILAAPVVVLALLLVASGTAAAHARLVTTDPAASAVLLVPPGQVVLRFDDVVTVDAGSLRVFGPGGKRVDDGGAHHPGGNDHAVSVGLPADLGRGSYVVGWRVISDDGHPVHGAYVFSIGSDRGAVQAAVVAGALATESGSPGVGAVAGLLRWAGYAGLLTLVGLALMVSVAWPEGGRTRRVGRILWSTWTVVLVATVAGIAIEGVYGALLPLRDVLRPSLADEVLHTRFGQAGILRAALVLAFVPVLLGIGGRFGDTSRSRRWLLPLTAALGLALLVATGLAGHASTGTSPALGVALDVVHLSAGSIWVGGLVLLAVSLLGRASTVPQPAHPGAATRTVSAWILAAVALVVVSGTAQAVRQVGSRYALFHTTYGWTLVLKVLVVGVLIGLGALSRRLVRGSWGLRHRIRTEGTHPDVEGVLTRRRGLGRTVVAELAVVLVVLAVTALLVNDVPAKQAAGLPFTASVTTAGVEVNAIVDPARAGIGNEIHVYVLSALGTPEAVLGLGGVLRLPSQRLGPLPVPLHVSGPGHYYATDVRIPVAGTWVLTFTVRTASGAVGSVSLRLPVH